VCGVHLFILSIDAQADLEPAVAMVMVAVATAMRNGMKFSHITWHEEAFHRLGFQYVKSLILVGALFPVDGRRRREGKRKRKEEKKLPWGRRVSLGLPCWLCGLLIAAVRCN
jgi:hypothetical protein